MIGTISIECNAKNPNMPLHPLRAYINSPSSLRITNVPKKIGKWNINKVTLVAIYPDSTSQTAECVLTGGVWVGTIDGSTTAGTLTQGYTILADGVDENGNDVTGYVLGKGDVEIMQSSSTPEPEPSTTFVRLQDDGAGARDGDMYPTESGYMIQQNGEPHLLGTPFDQITAYVDTQVSSKAEISDVEDLSNSLSNYYTKSETSSNVELNTKFDVKADLSTLTTKADVSALNTKRDIYDLELYADSVLDAPYYAVNVKYTDIQETAMDVLLKKMSGSTSLWVWQSGDGKSISLQKAGASTWMFTYQNLEDLSQNPQSGIFSNFSIDDPTQTLVLGDSYFRFEIKSYAGMIASQDYVNTQISSKADLSSTVDKALISQKLVNNLSDEHSTRVVVDEYDNVFVQKYVQSGWYIDRIEESPDAQTYTDTNAYYAYINNIRLSDVDGRMYFTIVAQDKQRNLIPIKANTFTLNYAAGEFITSLYWTPAQTGSTNIYLRFTIKNAQTPVWVNVARLVPDSSNYSCLLDTQIIPNGKFLTPSEVKPYSYYSGYARNALGSLFLYGRNTFGTPIESLFATFDANNGGKLCRAEQNYYPWLLSMYNGTTYDPPHEMTYGYRGIVQYRAGGRIRQLAINHNCWYTTIASGNNYTPYYILANEDADGYVVPDENLYIIANAHPLTFSANKLSVETIDGQTGNITCTRQDSDKYTAALNYYAYEEDLSAGLSAKADLSALENCWKKTDAIMSAENSFTVGDFNSISADELNNVYLGKGAGLVDTGDSGALMLESRKITSQANYDTAIITPTKIQQISKRGDAEPIVHGSLIFPRNDGQNVTLATEDWVTTQLSVLDTKRDLNDMTVKGIPPNAQQSRFNITDGTITNNAYWYDEGRWESGQTFAVYTTLTAGVYELKKHNTSEQVSVGTFSLDSNYEATITNDGTTYSIIGYAGDLVVNTELSSYATKNWVHDGYLPLSGGMMNGAIEWKSNYYQGVKGRLGYSADQGLLELYDNTKNKTTYFSPDMFTGLSSNVVYWPPESGTFATREWVMEQLAALSVMLQGGN